MGQLLAFVSWRLVQKESPGSKSSSETGIPEFPTFHTKYRTISLFLTCDDIGA